jgi:hypothetical protein
MFRYQCTIIYNFFGSIKQNTADKIEIESILIHRSGLSQSANSNYYYFLCCVLKGCEGNLVLMQFDYAKPFLFELVLNKLKKHFIRKKSLFLSLPFNTIKDKILHKTTDTRIFAQAIRIHHRTYKLKSVFTIYKLFCCQSK